MLDIKQLRTETGTIREGLRSRGMDDTVVDTLLALDAQRRILLQDTQALKNRRNTVSKEIGQRRKAGEDIGEVQQQMRSIGDRISEQDRLLATLEQRLNEQMAWLPNLPHSSVPRGSDASENEVVRAVGQATELDFPPADHVVIGERLGLFDFPRATRMSGSGFPLLTGQGARLQRALINFMLNMHTREHGYTEVLPPILCTSEAMTGTGQLPKLADDMYRIQGDNLYLIPTAEVPLTNMYREEIIEQALPIRITGYTPCFRREAGAAGRDTRGLIRVHQFDKIEMVKFVEPANSYDELEKLLNDAEDVLRRLELPYRVLALCSGDLSFAAAKCYDIELWCPGQNDWLEVSSCSNFEAFQARRAGIRYRTADGKTDFVHTLNGSGVALPRLVVALLENYQQADGTVCVPEALIPFMDGCKQLLPPTSAQTDR